MSIEVGDRVKVIYRGSDYYGEEGEVTEEENYLYDFSVNLDSQDQPNHSLGFQEDELKLVSKK